MPSCLSGEGREHLDHEPVASALRPTGGGHAIALRGDRREHGHLVRSVAGAAVGVVDLNLGVAIGHGLCRKPNSTS
eukprot:670939-Alexandrium_andersonii.AAC.1